MNEKTKALIQRFRVRVKNSKPGNFKEEGEAVLAALAEATAPRNGEHPGSIDDV